MVSRVHLYMWSTEMKTTDNCLTRHAVARESLLRTSSFSYQFSKSWSACTKIWIHAVVVQFWKNMEKPKPSQLRLHQSFGRGFRSKWATRLECSHSAALLGTLTLEIVSQKKWSQQSKIWKHTPIGSMRLMQVRNLKDPGAQCLGSVISPSKFGTRPVRRSGTAWFCNSVPSGSWHMAEIHFSMCECGALSISPLVAACARNWNFPQRPDCKQVLRVSPPSQRCHFAWMKSPADQHVGKSLPARCWLPLPRVWGWGANGQFPSPSQMHGPTFA